MVVLARSSSIQVATEFDLDLTIVSSGSVAPELRSNTDDGCGQTCESACSNSTC
ncbi:FxLD family lanthipeptide [Umezawaea sp. Da 62-37]|uniref:FxLD family lanthipeptide n=1 Tax=Umezawaea sp. Da 62-37 TaxID=3075927 RepID=UPI0028F6FBF1|nr:FxLD family lanthipeptide [Umezawaea sp. Da 62-37]WNV85040.1 FxLD family lanthipeptide [Umezawaea sp. Da 62-37]